MAKKSNQSSKPLEFTLKNLIYFVFLNIKEHILGIYQIATSYGKISNHI